MIPAIITIAGLALAAVAATVAGCLVMRVRRQSAIRRVTDGLDELARGNLVHRVVAPRSGEIAGLATAVNRLAEAMQASRSESLRREEAHSQLISNLSHDLRTPITSITGYVDENGQQHKLVERVRFAPV